MSLKYSIQQDQHHNLLPKHRVRRNHPYVPGCWSTAIRGIAFRHREPVSPPDNHKAKNDRYDILAVLESIGTGAYAQVRLGVGSDYNLYAIKTFRPRSKKVSHRSFLKAISSEYCIAATMDHPNIIKTLDFSIDQSGHYFTTMEYCADEDLCSAITHGSLTKEQKYCFFKQILQGVLYMHSMGVAHRDIKPENILIHGHLVRITDFGQASVMRDAWHSNNQLCFGVCGTVCYAAPEVFVSSTGYEGDKADMWSVGMVLYVLLYGDLLFTSAKTTNPYYRSFVRQHAMRRFSFFDRLDPEVTETLYHLLDPNPATRYTCKRTLLMPWITNIEACKPSSRKHDHCNHHVRKKLTPLSKHIMSLL